MPQVKKINLNLEGELAAWATFEAARRDLSVTGYINDAIKRDRDGAPEPVREAFEAFKRSREG